MKRKVLLIEPDYKNKYPPMGLMKIATYFREYRQDDVRFFKGDLKQLAAQLLFEEYYAELQSRDAFAPRWQYHIADMISYIKLGKYSILDEIKAFRDSPAERLIRRYHARFRVEDIPKFDIVCVTTLFTFYYDKTIETIGEARSFVKRGGRLIVGGIAATLLPEHFAHVNRTGLTDFARGGGGGGGMEFELHRGLLDRPGDLDEGDPTIIDQLPLDYSILDEIDYEYPSSDAYFGYTTRGCIRRCAFCAVPTLEPIYKNFVSVRDQIAYVDRNFGKKRELLLMDNNVLASTEFDRIIDEIKAIGFAKGATYIPDSDYEIAFRNLTTGFGNRSFNQRAYIRKIVGIYDKIAARLDKLSKNQSADFYLEREQRLLLYPETATIDQIIAFDPIARAYFDKHFKRIARKRHIDFNQGLDARLINDGNMKRLAEIDIKPLRIAFDHWEQRDIYERAVRLAAKYGIDELSNYLLYNFRDRPEELYNRMRLNVELCEELGVRIYSFPMRYHPIRDEKYFRNRNYVGEHWNKKFVRAVQAVMNSTKGKIGRGKEFFLKAFGRDLDEFRELLWMPEEFIINRLKYEDNLAAEWRAAFRSLDYARLAELKRLVSENIFDDSLFLPEDAEIRRVFEYYQKP